VDQVKKYANGSGIGSSFSRVHPITSPPH